VNASLKCVFDFVTGFAYARECAPGRIATRSEYAKQLAAGNDVETRARTYEQVQNSPIRIRFYRITNEVI
jgi:hypothetical protein